MKLYISHYDEGLMKGCKCTLADVYDNEYDDIY